MRPANNLTICCYLRRKPNSLGDDLLEDFEDPIYFRGRKETLTKRMPSVSGMFVSSTSTYIVTPNLPLAMADIKKDDVIFICGAPVSELLKMQNQKIWRVQSCEVLLGLLRIIPKDETEAEKEAPKRIEVL